VQTELETISKESSRLPNENELCSVHSMVDGANGRAAELPNNDLGTKNHRVEEIVRDLLLELGADLRDQHFQETPARVARMYRELTRGYRTRPQNILTTFASNHHELIVVSDINFYSLCPHHLLIYRGWMHFGYVPDGRIVGLSKIPRLIQAMAARLIVQEDLVSEVANTFMEHVKPLGCVVRATGRHDCVAVRGVRCHEAAMTTVALRGIFQQKSSLTDEFHQVLSAGARS
jgi:GTP cyclohydrolase IA